MSDDGGWERTRFIAGRRLSLVYSPDDGGYYCDDWKTGHTTPLFSDQEQALEAFRAWAEVKR